ncbi:MAG TPA: ADP-ribosylglycohydrolase family protein [Thermosynechococcaceae cyanobacterium]
MRYSLLSRFQGALVGMELGEALEGSCKEGRSTSIASPVARTSLSTWPPRRLSCSEQQGWGKVAVAIGENILQSDGRSLHLEPLASVPTTAATEAGLILASLPIVLFLHDDEMRLRQVLSRMLNSGNLGGALAISFAIAQALRENLEPLKLIPQAIAFLELLSSVPAYPGLVQQLAQVQTALEQNISLHSIVTDLEPGSPADRAVALAFYCFLSSPEDLRLSLLRSTQVAPTQSLSALTGAMSGAYNSTSSLPLTWRDQGEVQADSMALHQLGARLWTLWAGALSSDLANTVAIAAPDVIRSA